MMSIRRYLIPSLPLKRLPFILWAALAGIPVAGLYGVIHDQITFTISPEYFTKLKFQQFHYAHFGLSDRAFVAVIGFLATWWVGMVSGWFLARMANPAWPRDFAIRRIGIGFLTILAMAASGGLGGFLLGTFYPDLTRWRDYEAPPYGVTDLPAFVKVAYIHNGGYAGGLAGLVVALFRNRACEQP